MVEDDDAPARWQRDEQLAGLAPERDRLRDIRQVHDRERASQAVVGRRGRGHPVGRVGARVPSRPATSETIVVSGRSPASVWSGFSSSITSGVSSPGLGQQHEQHAPHRGVLADDRAQLVAVDVGDTHPAHDEVRARTLERRQGERSAGHARDVLEAGRAQGRLQCGEGTAVGIDHEHAGHRRFGRPPAPEAPGTR